MTMHGILLRSVLIGSLLVVSFAVGRATESLTPDASWWQSLTQHDRTASAVGLIEGYSEGYGAGYAQGAQALFSTLSKDTQGHILVDGRYLTVIKAGGISLTKTYGTYSDQLTHFYENYPALSDLPVGRVLQCMTDHAKQSCDDFAAMVIKARNFSAH